MEYIVPQLLVRASFVHELTLVKFQRHEVRLAPPPYAPGGSDLTRLSEFCRQTWASRAIGPASVSSWSRSCLAGAPWEGPSDYRIWIGRWTPTPWSGFSNRRTNLR